MKSILQANRFVLYAATASALFLGSQPLDAMVSIGGIASTWVSGDQAIPLTINSTAKKLVMRKHFLVEADKSDWRITFRSEAEASGRLTIYSLFDGEYYEVIVGVAGKANNATNKAKLVPSVAKISLENIVSKDADPLFSIIRFVFTPWPPNESTSALQSLAGVRLHPGGYSIIKEAKVKLSTTELLVSPSVRVVTKGWLNSVGSFEPWPTPFSAGFTNISIVQSTGTLANQAVFTASVHELVRSKEQTIQVEKSIIHELSITNINQVRSLASLQPSVSTALRVSDNRFVNVPGAAKHFGYTVESNTWYKVSDPRLHQLLELESGAQLKLRTTQDKARIVIVGVSVLSAVFFTRLFFRMKEKRVASEVTKQEAKKL